MRREEKPVYHKDELELEVGVELEAKLPNNSVTGRPKWNNDDYLQNLWKPNIGGRVGLAAVGGGKNS
jgi:hypothetical protein